VGEEVEKEFRRLAKPIISSLLLDKRGAVKMVIIV
jgi:hypothetical protein